MKLIGICERNATLGFIALLFSCTTWGVSYEDAPNLEPYPLTPSLFSQIVQIGGTEKGKSKFSLPGVSIEAQQQKHGRLTLSVDVDSRLNLWRGRPNDLSSSHLGSMKIEIDSVVNRAGDDVFDKSSERPWRSSVAIYHLGSGKFHGERLVIMKQRPDDIEIGNMIGEVSLEIPMNFSRFELAEKDPDGWKALLAHKSVSEVEYRDGIFLTHPMPIPNYRVTIMGFDKSGGRVNIVAQGTAGKLADNHWYSFGKEEVSRVLVFIPSSFHKLTIPFSIEM